MCCRKSGIAIFPFIITYFSEKKNPKAKYTFKASHHEMMAIFRKFGPKNANLAILTTIFSQATICSPRKNLRAHVM